MRKINNVFKFFYVERTWNDGDVDYFKVIGIMDDGRKWIADNPYIRNTNGNYFTLPEGIKGINLNDYRVNDKKITKEKFNQIKELI